MNHLFEYFFNAQEATKNGLGHKPSLKTRIFEYQCINDINMPFGSPPYPPAVPNN